MADGLRIVIWNCNGAFRRKRHILDTFNPDIWIIQECEDPATSKDESYRAWAENAFWVGDNRHKGLGVFARAGIALKKLRWRSGGYQLFLPCEIAGEFRLIAVWTKQGQNNQFNYTGQLWHYLDRHRRKLGRSGLMVAGDFNSHPQFDKPSRYWNASDVFELLGRRKIQSLYHQHMGEAHGTETWPTHYLHRSEAKPFHLDYAFLSEDLMAQVSHFELGRLEIWLQHSDHMPLFLEISGHSD